MKRLFYVLSVLLLPAIAMAVPGDDKFLGAREAYRVGAPVRLAQMAEALRAVPDGHDLAPWAEYWQLSLQLGQHANDSDEGGQQIARCTLRGTLAGLWPGIVATHG